MRIKVDSKSKMQEDKKADYESLATFIVKTSSPHNTWSFVTLISMPFSVSFSSLFHKSQNLPDYENHFICSLLSVLQNKSISLNSTKSHIFLYVGIFDVSWGSLCRVRQKSDHKKASKLSIHGYGGIVCTKQQYISSTSTLHMLIE